MEFSYSIAFYGKRGNHPHRPLGTYPDGYTSPKMGEEGRARGEQEAEPRSAGDGVGQLSLYYACELPFLKKPAIVARSSASSLISNP
jgi:hypothetical protein